MGTFGRPNCAASPSCRSRSARCNGAREQMLIVGRGKSAKSSRFRRNRGQRARARAPQSSISRLHCRLDLKQAKDASAAHKLKSALSETSRARDREIWSRGGGRIDEGLRCSVRLRRRALRAKVERRCAASDELCAVQAALHCACSTRRDDGQITRRHLALAMRQISACCPQTTSHCCPPLSLVLKRAACGPRRYNSDVVAERRVALEWSS